MDPPHEDVFQLALNGHNARGRHEDIDTRTDEIARSLLEPHSPAPNATSDQAVRPQTLYQLTKQLSDAFEQADEERTIRPGVYFPDPAAVLKGSTEEFHTKEGSGSHGETTGTMALGQSSNGSEESLIFPFSPPLRPTTDVKDVAPIEQLFLYDFPRLNPCRNVVEASEDEEPEEHIAMHGDGFSPYPRALWNSDDQDAHVEHSG